MFNFFKKKSFLTPEEIKQIVESIQEAEKSTSGEIRIFMESFCKEKIPLDRAIKIFNEHKMYETKERNCILIYLAVNHRVIAIYGDKGIHEKLGEAYWNEEIKKIIFHFSQSHFVEGLQNLIIDFGDALSTYFPFDKKTDKNELSDDIIFGK